MNLILAEAEEVVGNSLFVTDIRAEHIIKVLRAKVGDSVRVGIVNGMRGSATITAIHPSFPFRVDLSLCLEELQSKPPSIDLILALPRPIMLKRILSQAAALGVGTIHLINANRVEKSFWETGLLQPLEYRTHLIHGLEQAMDTRLPEVRLHRKFKPFIEDFCPDLVCNYRFSLCADPSGAKRLAEVVDGSDGRVLLAIGPEGGWVDYEVDKFREQGFACCTLGERILKVDTAVIALHSGITVLREMARRGHN